MSEFKGYEDFVKGIESLPKGDIVRLKVADPNQPACGKVACAAGEKSERSETYEIKFDLPEGYIPLSYDLNMGCMLGGINHAWRPDRSTSAVVRVSLTAQPSGNARFEVVACFGIRRATAKAIMDANPKSPMPSAWRHL